MKKPSFVYFCENCNWIGKKTRRHNPFCSKLPICTANEKVIEEYIKRQKQKAA